MLIRSRRQTPIFKSGKERRSVSTLSIPRASARGIQRVDYVEGEREKMFRIKYNAPKMKYKSDIFNLYLDENHVWVWTSTTDQKRGDLFDVYDFEGRYLDSFYIGPGRRLLKVQGDIIFVLEKDADENYRIVKYKIEIGIASILGK